AHRAAGAPEAVSPSPSCCPSKWSPRVWSARPCLLFPKVSALRRAFPHRTARRLGRHWNSWQADSVSTKPTEAGAGDAPVLLLVDDDRVLRERLARAFRDRGLEVFTASDFDEAMSAATAEQPEYAVVDLRMPGRSGLELVHALKSMDPTIRI